MQEYAILISLLLCAIVHFGYISHKQPYGWKKIITVIGLHFVLPFFMSSATNNDSAIGFAYFIFSIPLFLISWAMNRERRGKKIFKWQMPSFQMRRKKRSANSNSIDSSSNLEHLIEELEEENKRLRQRSKTSNYNESLDELDQLKSIRFGNE